MYEEFTRNDFETFKDWFSFIRAITNSIDESFIGWTVSTHTLTIDIPNFNYNAYNKADKIIGEYF